MKREIHKWTTGEKGVRTPALLDGAAVLPVRRHRDAQSVVSGPADCEGSMAAAGVAGHCPDTWPDGNPDLDIEEDRIRME